MDNIANDNIKQISIGQRLVSLIVDHILMSFLIASLMLMGLATRFYRGLFLDYDPFTPTIIPILIGLAIGLTFYLNKDIFKGRSIAKRFFKLEVIDNKTGASASPLKCLLRNMTILIWPIELVFIFMDTNRRLGDKLAGTHLAYKQENLSTKMEWGNFFLTLPLSLLITGVFCFFIYTINPSQSIKRVPYVKSSLAPAKSQVCNELFEKELVGLIERADIQVHDEIENDNRIYVHGNIFLVDSGEYDNFDVWENRVKDFLNQHYPPDRYIVYLKYIYSLKDGTNVREKLYDKEGKNEL